MKLRIFLAWYDFWVGAFYDRRTRTLYIGILPMIQIALSRKQECDICGFVGEHALYCVKRSYA